MLRQTFLLAFFGALALAAPLAAAPKKKLLLISQGPDGHPPATHEYDAGLKVLEKLLAPLAGQIDIRPVRADGDWREGPELLQEADAVVLFLAEGAKWVQDEPRRYEAFTRLADRGGGFVALHWAIGTREAKPIAGFQKLLGGCHGGPDRKYKVLETAVDVVDNEHPVTSGIQDFTIKDEFYYKLKFVDDGDRLQPLLRAKVDGEWHPVCWGWEREGGGRSFGFSGLHYHENWQRDEYQRLAAQAVAWTLHLDPPRDGWPGKVGPSDIKLEKQPQ